MANNNVRVQCGVCVVVSFILHVRFVDIPARVTQEERPHRFYFLRLPSAELSLFFLARRIQPFLSLVEPRSRTLCTINSDLIVLHLMDIFFFFFFVRKNPSSCDDTEIRTLVPTSEGFEATN